MPYRLEDCQLVAKSKGGECLSEKYEHVKAMMEWKCSFGHTWKTTFDSVKRSTWCGACKGLKRKTLEDCKLYAESRKGMCLSVSYKNCKTPMGWKCESGHIWESDFDHCINRNQWCPFCGGRYPLNLEQCRHVAESKGGKCLSDSYINVESIMTWQCDQGHIWNASMNNVKRSTWCPRCKPNFKLSIEDCLRTAKEKNGDCITDHYSNTSTHMMWKCANGHEWLSTYGHIRNGTWCPYCMMYKSEEALRNVFCFTFSLPFVKCRPQWLLNPETNKSLELDGYCEELKIAFEYNGIQHYEYTDHFHRGDLANFEKQQRRDALKKELCEKNNIKLYVIDGRIYDHTNMDTYFIEP